MRAKWVGWLRYGWVPVLALKTMVGLGEMDIEATVQRVREGLALVREDHEAVKAELDDLVRIRLDVKPGLIQVGEEIVLTIGARSETMPNAELEVRQNCYHPRPTIHRFRLDWQRAHAGDGWEATWRWRPPACGNYLLHWACDIGGDIPEFWRHFGVVDKSYVVMVINSTSHREPRPEPDLHEFHLPFSFWWEPTLYRRRPTPEHFAGPGRGVRQFGDDPNLLIFAGGDYLPDHKAVFYDEMGRFLITR